MGASGDEPTSGGSPALLLLVDGRFPSGGHAHSGGFEAIASLEGIADAAAMERFLVGRLHTVGLVAAAFAAAACAAFQRSPQDPSRLDELDRELDARTPSPALRAASRRLGRQALRAGRSIWPHPGLDFLAAGAAGPHQPVALGAVAAAARLDPHGAALAAAHESVLGPATAALRLLGLDPFAVHRVVARLSPDVAAVAGHGARHARSSPEELPALTGPLLDIAAECHRSWEVRLFAS